MEVQRPVRQIEERRRNDLPVVRKHREPRAEREHGLDRLPGTQPDGRQHGRQAERRRQRPDGRGGEHLVAADGPLWRGDGPDDVDGGENRKTAQGRDAEGAAAEEDRPDPSAVRRSAGHASARWAPRTPASSSSPSSPPRPTGISSSIVSR